VDILTSRAKPLIIYGHEAQVFWGSLGKHKISERASSHVASETGDLVRAVFVFKARTRPVTPLYLASYRTQT
jgi:hypothetical protein